MNGIVERLREPLSPDDWYWVKGGTEKEFKFNVQRNEAANTIERLTRVITRAQEAIATLPEDALGFGEDDGGRWPLRDELLHEIDAAIRNHKDGEGNG